MCWYQQCFVLFVARQHLKMPISVPAVEKVSYQILDLVVHAVKNAFVLD